MVFDRSGSCGRQRPLTLHDWNGFAPGVLTNISTQFGRVAGCSCTSACDQPQAAAPGRWFCNDPSTRFACISTGFISGRVGRFVQVRTRPFFRGAFARLALYFDDAGGMVALPRSIQLTGYLGVLLERAGTIALR